ncbi:MAG: molybdopterin-synthase adenylyltransferase MoeB [gamma proteobacterium symbiont of Taylorina sp.]|nr:molybdopterin-synthase adenylyltransferase MoeB [gamma proteobacterium symbiont of Taylorina sp.]
MDFSDDELFRYSRHILLADIDVPGQEKLFSAKVLIIGIGGLGSPVALYLTASGVGEITIADHDVVELNNLQRQIAHDEQDIGNSKVNSCYERMNKINSHIQVNLIHAELCGEQLLSQVAAADIVVDCTDNLTTRFEINKACVKNKKWLVSAAAIRWEGQISTYHCGFKESPCYHCFYGGRKELNQNCSNNGVLSPVVGVLGSMQAIEVIKLIVNKGDSLVGRVLLFDAFSMQWESMQLPKNPNCSVCGR